MTDEDKKDFETATHWFICGDKLKNSYKNEKEAEKYKKVRDHCHFTGNYRGCAHSIWNLNYCNKRFKIPVFFHNMKNYDGHLIIQNAEQLSNKKKIDVIAQNSQKFINIGFDTLSVKDTSGCKSASLDKLVSTTKTDNTDETDESKWILRATGKVTVDTVVKVIFSNRKVISFTNWKRSISVWLHETWIHLINFMKNNYPPKSNFTLDWVKKIYPPGD